jgi:hypothetical protein
MFVRASFYPGGDSDSSATAPSEAAEDSGETEKSGQRISRRELRRLKLAEFELSKLKSKHSASSKDKPEGGARLDREESPRPPPHKAQDGGPRKQRGSSNILKEEGKEEDEEDSESRDASESAAGASRVVPPRIKVAQTYGHELQLPHNLRLQIMRLLKRKFSSRIHAQIHARPTNRKCSHIRGQTIATLRTRTWLP